MHELLGLGAQRTGRPGKRGVDDARVERAVGGGPRRPGIARRHDDDGDQHRQEEVSDADAQE